MPERKCATQEQAPCVDPAQLVVIGVPGYVCLKWESRVKSFLRRIPCLRHIGLFAQATITYEIHNNPGDYYRFSSQTLREVFFDGMDAVEIRTIMLPPRIIGAGRKRLTFAT